MAPCCSTPWALAGAIINSALRFSTYRCMPLCRHSHMLHCYADAGLQLDFA